MAAKAKNSASKNQGAARPLVSVIMPVFNAGAFLEEAVASVQAQDWPEWELWLIDDGSTDDSLAQAQALAQADPRIGVLQTGGRQGPGPARNLGLQAARGRFAAFLDADDLWLPAKLSRQLDFMQKTGLALSCTGFLRRNLATGQDTGLGVPKRLTRHDLLRTNYIGCSTAMIDLVHFQGRHMPALRKRQDYAFWLDLLAGGEVAGGLNEALTIYHQRPGSVSAAKGRAAQATWHLYRHHLALPWPKAAYYFSHYALRGLLRHRAPKLAQALGLLQRPEGAEARPTLTIAIATMAARLARQGLPALPPAPGLSYHLFVQGDVVGEALAKLQAATVGRPDVQWSALPGRGAARSRNAALTAATTELLLFADDDLTFSAAGHTALRQRFAALPEADFLCGQLTDEKGHPRKRYPADGKRVTRLNGAKVGTPELALRPAHFRALSLSFDEAYGAGTANPIGDEYIFLCDAIRAGCRGYHVAIGLGAHPAESSGSWQDASRLAARRQALDRALGPWAGPLRWAFALKHAQSFPSLGSFWHFVRPAGRPK